MYTIRKQFTFSAAHRLIGLGKDHPCSRQHGHNYIVEIVLTGEPDKRGFIVDYRQLDTFKRWLDKKVDHQDLNKVLGIQTTAENIARLFFIRCKKWWPETSMVRVSETPKTWAEYSE